MKLHLTTLREGRNPLSETLAPERLGLDDEIFRDPVTVTGEADWSGDHAEVRLNIEAPGHFVCDRCAEEFVRGVTAEADVHVLTEEPPEDQDEEDLEGLVYAGRNGTVADLTDEIASALLLELPLKRLCTPECKGLCPVCYTNLNEQTCEHAGVSESKPDEPRGETIAEKLAKKNKKQN